MSRKILITSGKGGVGKSTITVLLAKRLAKANAKVLLVDSDLGLANLDILLDCRRFRKYDMNDVYYGKVTFEDTILKVDKNIDLLVLFSGYKLCDISNEVYISLISGIVEQYDYVLIDSPSGMEKGFEIAKSLAKEALVIINDEETSLSDSEKIIRILKNEDFFNIYYLLNKSTKKNDFEIEKRLGIKKLGTLRIKTDDFLNKILFKKDVNKLIENLSYIKTINL